MKIDNRLMTSQEAKNIASKMENLSTELETELSNKVADLNNLRNEVLNLQTSTSKSKSKTIKLDVKNLDSVVALMREEGIIEQKQLSKKYPETDVIDREALVSFLRKATNDNWQVSHNGSMFVVKDD